MRPFSTSKSIAGVSVNVESAPFSLAVSTAKLTTSCERGVTKPASGSHIAPLMDSSSKRGNFSLASEAEINFMLVPKAFPDSTLRFSSSQRASSSLRQISKPPFFKKKPLSS